MSPIISKSALASSAPATATALDFASASLLDTISALRVNPDVGLNHFEVDDRRKEHGYNEVAKKRNTRSSNFWEIRGISAWMLELIMVLSAVLGNYSDLAVVGALLVVNAVLSFTQEHPAAGVVGALRRQLQVSARVRRDFELADHSRKGIGARRDRPRKVRANNIIPADVKLDHRNIECRSVGAHRRIENSDKSPGDVVSSGSIVRRTRHRRGDPDRGEDPILAAPLSLCRTPARNFHIEAVVAKIVRSALCHCRACCWAWWSCSR